MIRALIVTPWATTEEGFNIPRILLDYPQKKGERLMDVTGQPTENIPPAINSMTADVLVESDTFAMIEADPEYVVLWSEDA